MTTQIKYKTWPRLQSGQFVVAGDVVLVPPGATEIEALRAYLEARAELARSASATEPAARLAIP